MPAPGAFTAPAPPYAPALAPAAPPVPPPPGLGVRERAGHIALSLGCLVGALGTGWGAVAGGAALDSGGVTAAGLVVAGALGLGALGAAWPLVFEVQHNLRSLRGVDQHLETAYQHHRVAARAQVWWMRKFLRPTRPRPIKINKPVSDAPPSDQVQALHEQLATQARELRETRQAVEYLAARARVTPPPAAITPVYTVYEAETQPLAAPAPVTTYTHDMRVLVQLCLDGGTPGQRPAQAERVSRPRWRAATDALVAAGVFRELPDGLSCELVKGLHSHADVEDRIALHTPV